MPSIFKATRPSVARKNKSKNKTSPRVAVKRSATFPQSSPSEKKRVKLARRSESAGIAAAALEKRHERTSAKLVSSALRVLINLASVKTRGGGSWLFFALNARALLNFEG